MPGLSATNITLETIASVYDGVPETSSISLSEYYRVSVDNFLNNDRSLYDADRRQGPPYEIHVRPEVSTVPAISDLETPVSAQVPISFSDFSNTNNKPPTYSKKFIVGEQTGVKGAPDKYGYNLTPKILNDTYGSLDNRYFSLPGVTATNNYYNHAVNEVAQNDDGIFKIAITVDSNVTANWPGNTGWSNIQLFDNVGTKQVSINRTSFSSFSTSITDGAVWSGAVGGSWLRTRSVGTSVTMEFN